MTVTIVTHPFAVTNAPMAHALSMPRTIIWTVGYGEHGLEALQHIVGVAVQEDEHLRGEKGERIIKFGVLLKKLMMIIMIHVIGG